MLGGFNERRVRILSGLITLVILPGLLYFGIKVQAAHALDGDYQVNASFDAAGQGLLPQSDVKIHGVNIGRVKHISLKDGRAFVRMSIMKDSHIPKDATLQIRPKTLFGEKFIDIVPASPEVESSGPFYVDEDTVPQDKTLGGFELEKVLVDTYPILKAIDPTELMSVLDDLAKAADGKGAQANRTIANAAKVFDVMAAHNLDTAQFLDNLAKFSDTLATSADDLVGAAQQLNSALPTLNARSAELAQLLDQAGRLSADLSDLIEANQGFVVKSITEGGKTTQLLFDERDQIGPLVTGLRQFIQALAEIGRIPYPGNPGTLLAAVKMTVGEEECPTTGRINGCGTVEHVGPTSAAASSRTAAPPAQPGLLGPIVNGLPTVPVPDVPVVTTGTQAVRDLLQGLLH